MYPYRENNVYISFWALQFWHVGPSIKSYQPTCIQQVTWPVHTYHMWPPCSPILARLIQHEKIVFQPNHSNHILAEISWHTLNGHLYMSAGLLLARKVTELFGSLSSLLLPIILHPRNYILSLPLNRNCDNISIWTKWNLHFVCWPLNLK